MQLSYNRRFTVDSDQLAIEKERTRQEEFRLQRARLLLSKNGLLLAIWALLTVLATFVSIFASDDNARWLLSVIGIFGFAGSVLVMNRVP